MGPDREVIGRNDRLRASFGCGGHERRISRPDTGRKMSGEDRREARRTITVGLRAKATSCAYRNNLFDVQKQKRPEDHSGRFCLRICLTMSYFHERMLTILGAEAFHGPVRDGKGWFHLAMVVRHDLSATCNRRQPNLAEVGPSRSAHGL